MSHLFIAAAILLLAATSLEARAADMQAAQAAASPRGRAAAALAGRHHPSVHDLHGQRYDVPNTLINGLPPRPARFD